MHRKSWKSCLVEPETALNIGPGLRAAAILIRGRLLTGKLVVLTAESQLQ